MNSASVERRPVPKRARPFAKAHKHIPWVLKMFLGRELSPSRDEYDRVVDALWDGDVEMDKLMAWMYDSDTAAARKMFKQAMDHGVGSIPNAPEPLRHFFNVIEKTPAWLDKDLLNEGMLFIHGTGLASTYVLRDLALMGGYLLSGFNQSLVMTGALNRGTKQRVAETGKWWMNCTTPNGLERFGEGFKTTIHVRMVHALVRRNLAARPDWDSSQWALPISQIDMVATYLGFSVVMLGGLRMLGIPVTPRESKAVMHLWSYTCWLMGVEEKWLVFTEREAIVLLYHTFMTQSKADASSKELAQALAQEPLERTFPKMQSLRRKLYYHQHLSISQYFLGNEKMAQLGLPEHILPWFPVLSFAPRLAQYSLQHWLPNQRKKQQQEGRKQQQEALDSLFGDKEQQVIQPTANHPAH